jgi:carbamoyl-phosphate synthase large subunit
MGYSILVTAVGGDIGQSLVRILRNLKQVTSIIGTDISDDNAGPYFVDKFTLVPPATDKQYISSLNKIIKENDITCVIPVNEAEIQVLNAYLTHDKAFAVPVIMANRKAISICSDKYETMNFLKANGLQTPWTQPISQEPPEYPCILKNRRGSGSRGLEIIQDRKDWSFFRDKRNGAILQELLLPDDSEYTCGVFRSAGGAAKCLAMRRTLANGMTSIAEVATDESIEDLCCSVADLLELRGAINIQLRKTKEGGRIFEINPRFSSTVFFRHCVGFCDLVWSIEDALNIKLLENLPEIKYGTMIYRYYHEVFKYKGDFFEC